MSQNQPKWGYLIFLLLVVGLVVFLIVNSSDTTDTDKAPPQRTSFVLAEEINSVSFGDTKKEVTFELGDPAYVFSGGLANSPSCVSYDVKEEDGNADVFLCFKDGKLTTKEKAPRTGISAVIKRNGDLPFN